MSTFVTGAAPTATIRATAAPRVSTAYASRPRRAAVSPGPSAVLPLMAVLVSAAVSPWLGGVAANQPDVDRDSEGAAVFDYLRALEARSPEAVADFIVEAVDRASDVDMRLRHFGGVEASKAEVQLFKTLSPGLLLVTIHTIDASGRALAWTERAVWRGGAWRFLPGAGNALCGDGH